jgi:hypothetical protein
MTDLVLHETARRLCLPLADKLGRPIKYRKIDIADEFNYQDESTAKINSISKRKTQTYEFGDRTGGCIQCMGSRKHSFRCMRFMHGLNLTGSTPETLVNI